jgi:putrescine transport system permease protein
MTASTAALPSKQQIHRKRNWLNFGLGAWSVLIYVFMFAPIGFVVAHSFTRSSAFEVWAGPPTLKWFHRLWNNDLLVSAVGNSLKAGLGSTIIATIIGSMAGITLARRPGKWSKYFLGLVFLILVTPEIVDAIGLFVWFVKLEQTLHLKNTIFTLRGDSLLPFYIGQSLFSSAVVTLIVRARMQGLDESLEEAAADLYATPRRAFFQVTLPLVAPAIMASALLAFTLSLDNTIVSQFIAPAGKPTYPVYVFSATKQILKPDIAAASTMLLGLTLTALGLVVLVLKRAGDSSSDIAATITGAG